MMSRSSGSSNAATTAQNTDPNGAPSSGGARQGARPGARGTVTKIDGSDITVQTTDQSGTTSTTVVRTSSDTTYTKSVSGSISDLQAGDNVIVTGDSSNGSVTATSINDMGDMTFGRRANRNGGQPPADFSGAPPNFSGAPPNNGSFPDGNSGNFPTPPSGGQGQPGGFTIGQITSTKGRRSPSPASTVTR